MPVRRWLPAALCGVIAAATVPPALAYEFEVQARTIGQGYQLRAFRLFGADEIDDRRRFTQILSLSLWDLGGRDKGRRAHDSEPPEGPRFSFSTLLRLDHDFGAFTSGTLLRDNRVFDVIDLVPELEQDAFGLRMLYGYLAAENLAGGAVDVYVGRQLGVDTLDWWSMDGVTARVRTPPGLAFEAFGGLRVRDASPWGSPTFEPDGTGGGECAEYVEGPVPGSGSWRPIDLGRPGDGNPFTNDLDYCPQREQPMPTFGGAIETSGLGSLWARVSYRRSASPTVGIIGPPDRFDHEDHGLYPNELGQAPSWGVNEERLAATVRARLTAAGGRARIMPYAAARYSLLHGLVDQAHAGVQLRWRSHTLEPEVYYSFPTFDGDSIFNVFFIEPYTDARATYSIAPRRLPVRAYVRGWARRFGPALGGGEAEGDAAHAGGAQGGVQYLRSRDLMGRLDLFHEDGYGGRRSGGFSSVQWRARSHLGLSGRLSIVDFREDLRPDLHATSFGAQLGATYVFEQGVAMHILAEETTSRIHPVQLRVIAVLDLAFNPEIW